MHSPAPLGALAPCPCRRSPVSIVLLCVATLLLASAGSRHIAEWTKESEAGGTATGANDVERRYPSDGSQQRRRAAGRPALVDPNASVGRVDGGAAIAAAVERADDRPRAVPSPASDDGDGGAYTCGDFVSARRPGKGFRRVGLRPGNESYCGAALLTRLGVAPYVKVLQPGRYAVVMARESPTAASPHAKSDSPPRSGASGEKERDIDAREFIFNARAVGPTMYAGRVQEVPAPPSSSFRCWVVDFLPVPAVSLPGTYRGDVLLTWVDEHFVGQRWRLPDRNNDPPFEEKKRRCLDLSLAGNGCDRFGLQLLPTGNDPSTEAQWVATAAAAVNGTAPQGPMAEQRLCRREDVGGAGFWTRADVTRPTLLQDPVGLNDFLGATWRWNVRGCHAPLATRASVAAQLERHGVRRILLFGDSMLVEQFKVLRDLLAPQSTVQQGKSHGRRWMQFVQGSLTVLLVRCYTTSAGKSLLAPARQIAAQVASFAPDLAVGNLAVLHWQQNMMPLTAWEDHVKTFARAVVEPAKRVKLGVHYFAHTLIQMGRTQGLQPQRTDAFTRVACAVLASDAGLSCFRPLELSRTRRESAYDGQHWACYHQYGGVAYSILSQWLQYAFA